jgi:hypothetical protein
MQYLWAHRFYYKTSVLFYYGQPVHLCNYFQHGRYRIGGGNRARKIHGGDRSFVIGNGCMVLKHELLKYIGQWSPSEG